MSPALTSSSWRSTVSPSHGRSGGAGNESTAVGVGVARRMESSRARAAAESGLSSTGRGAVSCGVVSSSRVLILIVPTVSGPRS